ncbi:MAG: glycosyltransferase family 2 protein [Alphaproteobacteria bacterium]|nr:glycosyltransferase family 2 protein [Alphaproteobacteria bacterium]
MGEMSIGVVIPHRNHETLLPRAIDRLLVDEAAAPDSVVIVDDCSDAPAREIVRALAARSPKITLIELSEHKGVVGALNTGVEAVGTDLVHCSAADDTVDLRLLASAQEGFALRPEAAIYSGRTRLISDVDDRDLGVIPSPSPFARNGWVSPEDARRTLMRRDGWIFGNSSVYRRDRLLEAGGFDPALSSFCDGYAQRYLAARWGALFDEKAYGAWRRSDTGVAARTNLDPVFLLDVGECAAERFRANAPEIFPRGYAERWLRRWISGALCFQLDRGVSAGLRDPAIRRSVPALPLVLADTARRLGPLGTSLAKLLIFAGLRPWDATSVAGARLALRFRRG